MKHLRALLISSLFVLTMVSGTAAQQAGQPAEGSSVPHRVQFGGVLRDTAGPGIVGITFALYKDQDGGAPLWLETQNVTPDATGHYSVQLGATKSDGIPLELFSSGEARWLGVQVSGQPEQTRVVLLSVPYALKAGDAETVGGMPPSAFMLAAPSSIGTTDASSTAGSIATTSNTGAGPDVGGSGTAGYVAAWANASNLGNSIVFQKGTGASAQIGIGLTNPLGVLDVKGPTVIRGTLETITKGVATPAQGFKSNAFDQEASSYSSSTSKAVMQHFEWQAEPTGNNTSSPGATLNLLFGTDNNPPAETGLKLSKAGVFTFAAGQTFPGAGDITAVNAGTDLTGGGLSGSITLNLDTTKVPQLASANSFTANQTVNGTVTATSFSGGGTGLSNVNAAQLGGLAANAFAQLAANNTFTGSQQFFNGNGKQMIVGDPGCGAGFAGLGFGALSGCNNYSLLGDGASTYINRPTGGSLQFRENNIPQMTITSGGTVSMTQSFAQFLVYPALSVTSNAEGNDGVHAFGGGGSTEFAIGGAGLLAIGGNEGNTETVGGDGIDTHAGNAFTGGIGIVTVGGDSSFGTAGGDGIDVYAGSGIGGLGYSGFFGGGDVNVIGNLGVSGQIFAGTKDFRVDHPLDPANKYFYHASVESSEMMNLYTGNVTLDGSGAATVGLPDWFEAVNTDFRYQLTAIGAAAPNLHIAQEVTNHQFSIAGGVPGMKVSWQVTGVRHDKFAQAHPLVVEEDKPVNQRGYYIEPSLYGQPEEKQVEWGKFPKKMRRLKEMRAHFNKPAGVK